MAKDPNLITSDQIDAKPAVEAPPAPLAPVAGQKLAEGKDPPKPPVAGETVTVRITKKGHEQVHDGEEGLLKWQAEIAVSLDVGLALEERGFGEIV
jgi:hypothetical protein